nr:hypothetical protein [Micromonospora orduensis]
MSGRRVRCPATYGWSAGFRWTRRCRPERRWSTTAAQALTRLLTDDGLRAAAGQVSREIATMPAPTDLVARLAALV